MSLFQGDDVGEAFTPGPRAQEARIRAQAAAARH